MKLAFQKMKLFLFLVLLHVATICLLPTASAQAGNIIKGTGATFPYPLYKKWFETYHSHTGTRIIYQPTGSGQGISALLKKETELGATDAFLDNRQLQSIQDTILHLPTCIGAVAVVCNVPNCSDLRFTPDILSDIFLGRIVTWSHKKIRQLNDHVQLPQTDIAVVHRSEGSGTSFLFTHYLSKVSKEWKKRIGHGKIVQWPCGMGVKGNAGVAKMVQKIEGSIGYVELSYAQQHRLCVSRLKNRSGEFILPGRQSAQKAASVELPPDARTLITDTPAEGGYPISGFTYFIFYKNQAYDTHSFEKARTLYRFLQWVIEKGQADIKSEKYAPLPESALPICKSIIGSMHYNGRPLDESTQQ